MYPTQRHLDGSTYYALAGRIMGGGSSVNVMSVLRPQRCDLEQWVAAGNPDWSYERCLPFMKKIESDQDFPDSPIHGKDGPLYVKRNFMLEMDASPPVKAFLQAAYGMGLPQCPDLNVPEPYGVCASPYNIKDGKLVLPDVTPLDARLKKLEEAGTKQIAVLSATIEGKVVTFTAEDVVKLGARLETLLGRDVVRAVDVTAGSARPADSAAARCATARRCPAVRRSRRPRRAAPGRRPGTACSVPCGRCCGPGTASWWGPTWSRTRRSSRPRCGSPSRAGWRAAARPLPWS